MSQEHLQDLFAGKFRLLRLLGKGAMGEVWLAEEVGPRNFRRQVALKRLLATEGISEYARESFIAEAQVIARLDHPNIVRLIELGEADGRGLFLGLDYIDGAALDRLLRKAGALSPAAVALVGREVARALDAVHSMTDMAGQNLGVVHRDVSPANILVGRDGRVRLSDFGVARIHGLGGEKTETGIFKGKLPYMPPEQALGEPFDGRADVFSLGVTIFEALIGGRLRKAETQGQLIAKIATERVPRVHEVVPDAMPALAQAIDAATEFRSEDRIPSAGHLAAAMNGVLFSLGPAAEQAAFAELAERVGIAAGAASTAPTTKQPWSLALSGELPAFGHSGTNPRAYVTGSGSYSNALGASGPHSHPVSHGSGPHLRESGPHAASLSQSYSGGRPPAGPPSVPPQGPASVTRIASITDTAGSRTPPPARTWAVALAIASLVGVGAGALWVVFGKGNGSTGEPSTATSGSQQPDATKAAATAAVTAIAAQPSTSAVALTDASASAAPSSEPKDPKPKKNGAPTPRPTANDNDPVPDASSPGTLQVTVSPWGNVSVDGVPRGTTPIGPISLPPGPHTVSVTNPDLGASRSATVKVVAGKQATVGFDLKKSQ